jgi:hypothetical protein
MWKQMQTHAWLQFLNRKPLWIGPPLSYGSDDVIRGSFNEAPVP